MTYPYPTVLTLDDCVCLIARNIGASHFKCQVRGVRWTIYKMIDGRIEVRSIRFINLPNEMFNIGHWRKGKLPDGAVSTVSRAYETVDNAPR